VDVDSLIAGVGANQLVAFMLVIARVAPLFIFAPLFSSKMLSYRLRGIVAVGMAFAFTIGILFYALQAAGGFLDTIIGFAFGASVDPISGNQGTILGQFYGLIGLMIFVVINGDAMVLRGLGETYQLVPLLEFPRLDALVDGVWGAFVGIFTAALQVAAPVVLALVLTDLAFGLVTRVVPQLNVFSVGLPAKVLVGMLLISASLPFVAGYVDDELERSVRSALTSLGVS
jgi:flagellar biosynthetic protein FliR